MSIRKNLRTPFLLQCLAMITIAPVVTKAQQTTVTISGYVSEKGSQERLTGAIVFAPGKNLGTATNTYGFYSLTLPADSQEIRVSYVGFRPFLTMINGRENLTLNIELEPEKILQEVAVTAQKDALQERTQMSSIDLSIETIKSLPAFLGEVDIMKAIQLLPGVQAGNEGSSGVYVRGGSPDQNLILLDGVPVYNAYHLFGFFSVFNPDAIRNVEVIKGGFPARYGGRLSSVIDISMKEGDKNKFHGEGGIGLIASRLTLEGPIQKGKSSFMISGRRTYVDLLSRPFMQETVQTGYFFYDLNGKVNFRLGKKDHLYISGYFGNDKFYMRQKEEGQNSKLNVAFQWGNATAVARWNHQYNPKLFGNLTLHYTQYNFIIHTEMQSNYNGIKDNFLLRYTSGINDKAMRYDFDYMPNPNHYIRFGAGITAHTYSPGAQQHREERNNFNLDTTVGVRSVQTNEIDVYLEDDIRITSRLKANIGIHWSGFQVRNEFFGGVQPRVSARYLITDRLSAKMSYVQMNQFIHMLSNSTIGLPTDLWVPVTDKIPMQYSRQGAAGLAHTTNKGIEISMEGYYKHMSNVIEYKEGASFFNSGTSWEDKVETGEGWSYGMELFLQKRKGKLTGMAGYTLSWTNRRFANLNNGAVFPYRYDRRHDIKLAGVYHVSDKLELSATWVYGTGNALTIPVGAYKDPDGNQIYIYGSRNSYRMAPYHRGDISLKYTKNNRWYQSSWVVSIYNVYNRRNPFFIYQGTENEKPVFKQVSLFPIIPSISYQFKF